MHGPSAESTHGRTGVFTRKEALSLGLPRRAIALLVRNGEWVRVRRGAYVLRDGWTDLAANARYGVLCRAVVRQANTEVVLSHLSARQRVRRPAVGLRSHVRPPHADRWPRGPCRGGVRQHRGVVAPADDERPADVTTRNGLAVMTATRTALELTTVLDVEHSVVEIDHLLHRNHTTVEELRARYEAMSYWPSTLTTDLVLRLVDARSESVGESRARFLCWAQHLPAPVPNHPIHDVWGNEIARVDLAWPGLGVFLEFDGKEKYLRHRREGESVVDCVLREKQRGVEDL